MSRRPRRARPRPLERPAPRPRSLPEPGLVTCGVARLRRGAAARGKGVYFPSVEGLFSLYTYLNVSSMYLRLDTYLDVSGMYPYVSHVSSTQVTSSDVFSMYLSFPSVFPSDAPDTCADTSAIHLWIHHAQYTPDTSAIHEYKCIPISATRIHMDTMRYKQIHVSAPWLPVRATIRAKYA